MHMVGILLYYGIDYSYPYHSRLHMANGSKFMMWNPNQNQTYENCAHFTKKNLLNNQANSQSMHKNWQ